MLHSQLIDYRQTCSNKIGEEYSINVGRCYSPPRTRMAIRIPDERNSRNNTGQKPAG